jgi:Flp pilus assembly protein CpaB
VVTAARDLDGGAVLVAGDLTRVAYADGTAPDGTTTLDDALGRTLAAPMRRGEAVTDVRLVGPGLLAGYDSGTTADVVALPVRIPDPGVVGLLRVGDRVNLLATDPSGGGTTTVATDVPVLALPQPDASAQGLGETGTLSGRLVVVGTTRIDAEIIENAAVQCFLSVAL